MPKPVDLRQGNVASLADRLPIPRYDRAGLVVGIAHIGVGAFHRSHHAAYLDRLFEQGESRDFAVCGIGVLDTDVADIAALASQDCLYTLALRHPDGHWDGRVIGSIRDVRHVHDDVGGVLETLAAPTTRIMSLTITEGGYNLDPRGLFDLSNPQIARELSGEGSPTSVFGLTVAALRLRRERGLDPFTIMSCDNIEANGVVAQSAFLGYAAACDESLAAWIAEHGAFPNSMVDRITPRTTSRVQAEIEERFGVRDLMPVTAEPFVQWVLEDDFPLGRPAYERAGVQMVSDVRPFELMKLRLLNGSHQALAYLGLLAGHHYVHQAAADPDIARFVRAYMAHEAAATLPAVPDTDLDAYQSELMIRFGNREIEDTLDRVAAYPSDRMPKFVLPVLSQLARDGRDLPLGTALLAAFAGFCLGLSEDGQPLDLLDFEADSLRGSAAHWVQSAGDFLALPFIPEDLRQSPDFVRAFAAASAVLRESGVRRLMATALQGSGGGRIE